MQIVPWELPPKGPPPPSALPAAGQAARNESSYDQGNPRKGRKRSALRPGDDQDQRRPRRADGAGGAPERIPGRQAGRSLGARIPTRGNGRAGVRLRQPDQRRGGGTGQSPARATSRASRLGTIVGQQGLEYQYDRYLRGTPGEQPVEIDSENQVQPTNLPATKPRAGYTLRLTLDLALQKEGEIALRKGMELAHALGHPGNGGAFLAMEPRSWGDPRDGLLPELRPQPLHRSALDEAELDEVEQVGRGQRRAASPNRPHCSTARPKAPTRPARRSSRSPRSGASKRACSTPTPALAPGRASTSRL